MEKEKDIAIVTEKLMTLCSKREYSSSDVFKKALKALDGNKERAQDVLRILIAEKYVDDLRFSSAYARDKASIDGWGKSKIRYMLLSKGIERSIIDDALLEIDEHRASQRLEKLLQNKINSLKNDPQKRQKIIRFAIGRGYPYDDVKDMVDRMIGNNDD